MPTKAQRAKQRKELLTRLVTRASGVAAIVAGLYNERLYLAAKETEPVHGTLAGFSITTSFILIVLGVVILALSFPKIYSLVGRIINRKKPQPTRGRNNG